MKKLKILLFAAAIAAATVHAGTIDEIDISVPISGSTACCAEGDTSSWQCQMGRPPCSTHFHVKTVQQEVEAPPQQYRPLKAVAMENELSHDTGVIKAVIGAGAPTFPFEVMTPTGPRGCFPHVQGSAWNCSEVGNFRVGNTISGDYNDTVEATPSVTLTATHIKGGEIPVCQEGVVSRFASKPATLDSAVTEVTGNVICTPTVRVIDQHKADKFRVSLFHPFNLKTTTAGVVKKCKLKDQFGLTWECDGTWF